MGLDLRSPGAWPRAGVGWCGDYAHAGAGVASLAGGLLLFAFSLLVRAKPVVKSVDALTHELSALIVLNGGIFRQSPDSTPIHEAQILVHPEQIIVLGPRERRLLEIPLAKVRNLAAHPVTNGSRRRRRALGSGNQLAGRWALHDDISL